MFINTNKRTLHTLTTNKVYKDYFYFYIDSLYIEDIHDCIEIKTSNPLLLIHKIIFSLFFVKFFNIDSFLKLTKNNYMYICILRNEDYHMTSFKINKNLLYIIPIVIITGLCLRTYRLGIIKYIYDVKQKLINESNC